jgi:hypothetical protein
MSARNFYIMPSALGPMQDDLPCYTPLANHETEVHVLPLVLASDYDALAADNQRLEREAAIMRVALTWIAIVNAMDYEYVERAKRALAALTTANGEGE